MQSTAAATGVALADAVLAPRPVQALSAPPITAESLASELFRSLTEPQQKVLCFPIDHELRGEIDNNWRITKPMDQVLSAEQRDLVKQLFLKLHSEEYAPKVLQQVIHDNNGFDRCSLAFFGQPGAKPTPRAPIRGSEADWEFVFTGRHVTRRCDSSTREDGVAFGGPIFYGHAAQRFNEAPDHPGNIYWYQAVRANELFKALDEKQRKLALRTGARDERGVDTVAIHDKPAERHGMPVTELTADQKGLLRKVMDDLLAPFRPWDRAEAAQLIESTGGVDSLQLAYYSNLDVGKDGVWDVWQIEGPQMVWYFRGYPHVHTWVHLRKPPKAAG
jgi:hypothetical protein